MKITKIPAKSICPHRMGGYNNENGRSMAAGINVNERIVRIY
jgi:hypothetical protein